MSSDSSKYKQIKDIFSILDNVHRDFCDSNSYRLFIQLILVVTVLVRIVSEFGALELI